MLSLFSLSLRKIKFEIPRKFHDILECYTYNDIFDIDLKHVTKSY